jgi:imidazolonepropionase-like amidohydrolase
MVRYGMTPIEAIRTATIDAAAVLGRGQELGAVASGRYADLIAVTGDPLADITRLEHVAGVIKEGHLFDPGD